MLSETTNTHPASAISNSQLCETPMRLSSQFLQRVRIARNADCCNRGILSVRLSFRHILVFCPEE